MILSIFAVFVLCLTFPRSADWTNLLFVKHVAEPRLRKNDGFKNRQGFILAALTIGSVMRSLFPFK